MRSFLIYFTALCLIAGNVFAASTWHTFTNRSGQSFRGQVIEVNEDLQEALVIVESTGRNITLDFKILSDKDLEYLLGWYPGYTEEGDTPAEKPKTEAEIEAALGEANPKLYPHTRKEVREMISEIKKRKPPEGIDRDQQEVINTLNIYRYLCGVTPDAIATKQKVAEAHQAAAACEKNGGLSHDLGSYTNKCNLHSGGTMLSSVRGYIGDGGANNREKRGHRRWCLNPKLHKTGFGSSGRYSAMWALDQSGKSKGEFWAYPGVGYFPEEYLHGDAWSFYSPTSVPATDKIKIEVFKLRKRPEKKFGITADIPGRTVAVGYIHAYSNTINFEPDQELVSKGGVFWVRINGPGLRESYLVELY